MKISSRLLAQLKRSILSTLAFAALCAPAFALPTEGAYRLPSPTRGKVGIQIDERLFEGLSETEKQEVRSLVEQLESRMYSYENLTITLPTSLFEGREDGIIDADDLFRAPSSNELARLAGPRLNADQLQQVRRTGRFIVPSREHPGQNHVWQLTVWLQKGTEKTTVEFKERMEAALGDIRRGTAEITIGIPERIWGSKLSLREGFSNMLLGLKETAGLFVGLTENERLFSDREIEHTLYTNRQTLAALTGFDGALRRHVEALPEGFLAYLERAQRPVVEVDFGDGQMISGGPALNLDMPLDLRMYDDRLTAEALAIAHSVQTRVMEAYTPDEEARVQERIIAQRASAGLPALSRAITDRFLDALAGDAAFERLSPGLGALIANHARAQRISAEFEAELAAQVQTKRAELTDAENSRTLRRGSSESIAESVEAQLLTWWRANLWTKYRELPVRLFRAGLAQEAALVAVDLDYMKETAGTFRTDRTAELEPAGRFTHHRRIWRTSQYRVEKSDVGGVTRYRLAKTNDIVVDTGSPGWRLWNTWNRIGTWWNNGLYHYLVTNLWNGPIGVRALVGTKTYYPSVTVNDSGEVVTDTRDERGTLVTRLAQLKDWRDEAIAKFHARPGYGFLGKDIERILLFFKVDIGSWLLPSALLAVAQPTATVANIAVGAAFTATSAAWAPVSAALALGFNALVYDTNGTGLDAAGNGARIKGMSRFFPAWSTMVVDFGMKGVAQTALAAAGIGFWHPTMAALNGALAATRATVATVRSTIRSAWDLGWYGVIARFGHIPDSDIRHLVRRVEGPGLTSQYFFQVENPNIALVTVMAAAEAEATSVYGEQLQALIERPAADAQTALRPYFTVFESLRGGALKELTDAERANSDALSKAQRNRASFYGRLLDNPARGSVKLSAEQLDRAIRMSAATLERFYARVFADLPAAAEGFWSRQGLVTGDWAGLARKHLVQVWGEQVLTPMEATDSSMRIVINDASLIQAGAEIAEGITVDDLDRVNLVGTAPVREERGVLATLLSNADAACRALLLPEVDHPKRMPVGSGPSIRIESRPQPRSMRSGSPFRSPGEMLRPG